MHLTIHAIFRWLERNNKINVELERSKCAIRWGYYKHNVAVTDTILFKWLKQNLTDFNTAYESLQDIVVGHSETFIYDDLRFVVRDGSLITVHEV